MAAEPVPGLPVEVVRDAPCRVRDGTTLYADVYRPVDAGPQPALLMREPYDKTTAQTGSGYSHPSWYARGTATWWWCRISAAAYSPREGSLRSTTSRGWLRHGRVGGSARRANGRAACTGRPSGAVQLPRPPCARPPGRDLPGPDSQYYEGWTYKQGALPLAFAAMGRGSGRAKRDTAAATGRWPLRTLRGSPPVQLVVAAARFGPRCRRRPLSRLAGARGLRGLWRAGAPRRGLGRTSSRRFISAAGTTSSSRGPLRTSPACGTGRVRGGAGGPEAPHRAVDAHAVGPGERESPEGGRTDGGRRE